MAIDDHNNVHHYIGDTIEQKEDAEYCLRQMSNTAKGLYRYEIQELKL